MWVVKLGGSLTADAELPRWLELLTHLGSGRVAIVPGGGSLADEVRRLQGTWQFDDLAAHNMAVLAMAQTAYLMQALQSALHLATDEPLITGALRRGKTALWCPLNQLRSAADATTNWSHTSDSLALMLAERLNAERLVVVKRVSAAGRSLAQLCQDGVLDAPFATLAQRASFPVHVLASHQCDDMRSLLLGQRAPPASA